jgi:hypothetical protein
MFICCALARAVKILIKYGITLNARTLDEDFAVQPMDYS